MVETVDEGDAEEVAGVWEVLLDTAGAADTMVEGNSTGPGALCVVGGGPGGAGISAVLIPVQLCN